MTKVRLEYLTSALKAPTLRDSAARLAQRAPARESHGGEGRIRAAKFPARKSLEDFDFAHARGLKRETIAHLGTLDLVAGRENVILLGRDPRGSVTYRSLPRGPRSRR